ncbi:hypothetical protein E3N88_02347 [Mikania micrantha]|uniref:Uncharacterized protein n=1 Tax=Mikania micrantha TaxID=192012 RepID=A0A5N6Q5H4_9ASTR|nr:hypothetical protein E3N88_02347 [Mikania micrantha]
MDDLGEEGGFIGRIPPYRGRLFRCSEIGNLMDIQVKERIRALIPGLNLMGGEGLRNPSGVRASGGTRVSRSEIEESILAINRQDN